VVFQLLEQIEPFLTRIPGVRVNRPDPAFLKPFIDDTRKFKKIDALDDRLEYLSAQKYFRVWINSILACDELAHGCHLPAESCVIEMEYL
jgi:hypothetical protein